MSDATFSTGLSTGESPPPSRRGRGGRGRFSLAIVAALLAHGAALGAFLLAFNEPYGAGGVELEAIEVTLVDARDVAVRSPDTTPARGGATNPPVNQSASAASPEQAAVLPTRSPPEPSEAPPVPDVEAIALAPMRPEPQPEPKPDQSGSPAANPPQAASMPATPGGPSVDAAPSSDAGAPPVAAARPGVAAAYSKSVVAALAKTKPGGVGNAGVVRVAFTISERGELDSARVSRSSGNDRLDALAMKAVQRARFETPPAGMTTAQLTYEIPYQFR